ncbi:MAG: (2Fe-2S)-binding protein [Alphaproteobacteria bacterium]|nr:MAG: (2Fe-2S)-binding protein [Alphaproteobacteria bacterium]
MAVPATLYTDPARWEREMEMIFHRLPLLMALSVEMPNPGDYKAMYAMGKPLLLTRTQDGTVKAFWNVCTHRGGRLAEDGRGNCKRFSCIYHGWTFSNDGRLLAIADRAKFGDLDTAELGLTELPCAERAGLIFVTLTPGLATDIDAFLGGILPDLEQCGLDKWHYVGSREIFGANWKVAYDGYLEGYHFAAAHPDTINARTFSNVMHFEAFGPHMRTAYAQRAIDQLKNAPKEKWGEMENQGYDFVRTLFPNVSIFLAPEIGQISQLFPGPTPDRNRTILHFVTARPPATDEDRETVEQMVNFLRNVVNDEDYALGLKVQKGLESGAIDKVLFGRNERGNQLFHKYVDYYVNADPTAPEPTL